METLISFDKSGHDHLIAEYENNIPVIQDVIDSYKRMQLPDLTNDDFKRLFSNTDDLLFDKMTGGEPVHIGSLKLDKAKALEILHKPDGYTDFITELNGAISWLKSDTAQSKPISINAISNYYELNTEGNVSLKKSFAEQAARSFKRYATSDKANKVLQFANAIIDKSKELGVYENIVHNPNGVVGFMRDILEVGSGKELTVKAKGILEYNR